MDIIDIYSQEIFVYSYFPPCFVATDYGELPHGLPTNGSHIVTYNVYITVTYTSVHFGSLLCWPQNDKPNKAV